MNFLFHFKSLQGKVEKWAPNGLFEEVERPHPIWTNEASLDTSNATSSEEKVQRNRVTMVIQVESSQGTYFKFLRPVT